MAQLYFNYASMNAGKSASLLTAAHNYKERGMGTLILKPGIDDRDSATEVVSRIGLRQEANVITPDMDIFEFFKWAQTQRDIHCVFVDEAQFLTEANVHELCKIVDIYNVPVMAYGLRTDFRGKLFTGSASLLAVADKLIEMKGVCHCGRKATMVARIDENGNAVKEGNTIELGGEDKYVSLCRKHWCELTGM
ncbi:thymidine kinase [Salmonella phage vB_SenM-AKM_NP4]|uniref:Thymidine kinase n=2 Tax=Gelderlandvirus TaxID=1913653 RepID=M1EAN9_BPS16|nr:thymidine kinase [Salmonella phage vB_SenM-S16]YP_009126312.1 thymidine kinase [Salmonella phage STP4-a]UFK27230.1 thymidine kinase [Escherichia phage UoN_LG358_1]WDR21772.1 thymidine kinase [Salmonella phage vB_SenM_UTK0003]WLI71732.1 thymidine kinase [Salmonella phage vB_SenM-AKM_NP4]AEO97067.1 thymidine kinase [Salmonella phage vB_SenM-S16]AHJ86959.1 thymidine kinase [Salmonella phage STP4-a]